MIRSTFAGFTTAQLAMAASQKSMDVVGQNIANINTSGYTRQRLDLQSISPSGHSQMNSQNSVKVGQGVTMTGVSQIRDPFLDIQYRNQLSEVGTEDAKNVILDGLGDIFDESSRSAIRSVLNDVVSQLENMATPDAGGQDTLDKLVRSSMEVLINYFHESGENIESLKTEIITRLEGTEEQKIQAYLDNIVELNQSIKNSQVLGEPALELMDQRNAIIDELATYLPINVTYEKKSMGGNVSVETLKITFKDSEGESHVLIDDNTSGAVDIQSKAGMPPLQVIVTGIGSDSKDVANQLGDGVLQGYADMLNKHGAFDDSDIKGIGYYEDYFNSFIDTFAKEMNKMNMAGNGGAGGALFQTSDGSDTFTANNIMISKAWMDGSVHLETSTEANGPGGTNNDSAYDNILAMINMLTTEKHKLQTKEGGIVFEGCFLDIYDNLQNTQATEMMSSTTILENRVTVLNQIADAKDSVSGVYLDEEVMNLMKFQQSYNAAARLMTTLDEALDTLINNTGVVGR